MSSSHDFDPSQEGQPLPYQEPSAPNSHKKKTLVPAQTEIDTTTTDTPEAGTREKTAKKNVSPKAGNASTQKSSKKIIRKPRKSAADSQSSGLVEEEEREELIHLHKRMQKALQRSEEEQAQNVFEENAELYLKKLRNQQGVMPIGDHLEELRWRIIRSLLWILLFSSLAFLFYSQIWNWIMGPILPLIDNAEKMGIQVKMITTKLSDYVILQFKIAFMVGFVFAIPTILIEIWHFILPALGKVKKIWGNFLFIFSILLFSSGFLLARLYLWPMVTGFMIYDWAPPSMFLRQDVIKPEVHLILDDYLGFFFMFHLAFGLAFQLPVVTLFLALLDILSSSFYFRSWRYAILILAVLSAMVTPPDITSMAAMMFPLLFLYLFSGVLIWLVERFKKIGQKKKRTSPKNKKEA